MTIFPQESSDTVLELADVHHAYKGGNAEDVIHGMSFRLQRGEIGCLLGPSGCGKTTVLRCIAGFEPIRSGRIAIAGETVSS